RPRPRRSQKRPEQLIHRAVIEHLRLRAIPGLLWWHTPQGAPYGALQGAIMSGLGVRAGVSDLLLLHAGKLHALELKAPARRPSPAQVSFLLDVAKAGGYAEYADNIDPAVQTL